MSTEKLTVVRTATFMQYLKHPDTGEELYSEDKSFIKALYSASLLKKGLPFTTALTV